MNIFHRASIIALLATTSGCATFFPPSVTVGDTEANLLAKRGQPTQRYQDGKDTLLEYAHGPMGQVTYMARLDPGGKVISFEQVLTTQKFATIKVGETNKDEVLHIIGAPSFTSYLPLRELEVWSYPYKESNIWNSIMHVHIDKEGIVRQMLNGPDPRFDPDSHFPMRVGRRR